MSQKHYLDIVDPTFTDDLRKSERAVAVAARWLEAHGHAVTIHPIEIRPDPSQRADFYDDGDLTVDGQRVEVKRRFHRFGDFHSAESFPDYWVIVDTKSGFDRADPKPVFYMIFNESMTGFLRVNCDTQHYWRDYERLDQNKRPCVFYECPRTATEYFPVSTP